MAKAKKLPSGQWRVLVYSHTENGKRKYESFTGPTKADAEMLASEFAAKRERHSRLDLTVRDAIDGYIKAKENVLSPSTIKEYKRMQDSDYNNIMSIRLRKITSEDMQLFISDLSSKVSPKTVKNRYGLLRAAIGLYSPDTNFRVTFPQKKVTRPVSPSEDAVRVLYKSASDHLRPCIALAMCGLRRGEIAALRYEDIENGVAHIHADMVIDSNNKWVYKELPKTDGSDRFVKLPQFVLDLIGEGEGYIISWYTPNSIG
jgi:integrase